MFEVKTYRRIKDMERDMTVRFEEDDQVPVFVMRWFYSYTVIYRK